LERFFGMLKPECFHLAKFSDIKDLRVGLRRYIQDHSHQRTSLKLNGLSPVQYRTLA